MIIVIIVSLFYISYHSIKSIKPELLKIGNNISFVFTGDSNVECAINDKLISNSINIAQSGEAYLFTFTKLRSLLEYNPQIKTIFLGFSYNNLLKTTEDLWLFEDSFVIEKIKNYNYLLSEPERQIIKDHNLIAFVKGILQSITNNLSVFIMSYFSSIRIQKSEISEVKRYILGQAVNGHCQKLPDSSVFRNGSISDRLY